MATEAKPADTPVELYWKEAQKSRRTFLKKLDQLNKSHGKGNEDAYLEGLENALSAFRFGCMATIFTDFNFASEQSVEKALWNAHAATNSELRNILARLNPKEQPNVTVLHRQVQKRYGQFLRTSQSFYKGYVQRVSARYPIPELERVAKSMNTDNVPLDDIAPERNHGLAEQVLKSCHTTLIHLGDLARYRRQVDRKPHGPGTPLLYYGLAHDLIPTMGHGHHQMAVVFLNEKDSDLQAVYHLYRALTVQTPHPMAAQNLEAEFKKLRPGSPMRGRNASLDPKITLASWFVRLHAIFYVGKKTSQQKELEREVLHRMQILLVSKDGLEWLLMMVLTNISAYYWARKRAEENWSEELSQSCQFILSFNVRVILLICNVLTKEVNGALNSLPTQAADSADSKAAAERFRGAMKSALPLLRVYMAWLCMYRGDIVKYANHISDVSEMHQSVAEIESLLIEHFRPGSADTSTCSYMLLEDIEVIAFEPLNNEGAPFVCRSLHFMPDGKRKARLEGDDSGPGKLSEDVETLGRINDIITCGYFLGTDPRYPLSITNVQQGTRSMPTISYMPRTGSSGSLAGFPVSTDFSSGLVAQPLTPQRHENWSLPPIAGDADDADDDDAGDVDGDFGVDGETLNRVNEFLAPPEVNSPRGSVVEGEAVDETSYGMHTNTANEIFGALDQNATTPTSASGKAFPGLPWNLIFTPKPYRSVKSPEAHHAAAFNQPNYSYSSTEQSPVEQKAPIAPRGLGSFSEQEHFAADALQTSNAQPANRGLGLTESIFNRERMEEISRAASWNVEQRRQPILAAPSIIPPSILPVSRPRQSLASMTSQSPIRQPSLPTTQGFANSSFFQSSNFSHNASGLPPVNSPRGLPPQVPHGRRSHQH